MKTIPVALIALRILLGPVVFVLAEHKAAGIWVAICLILAFLSDVFDGVIARRLHIAVEKLRVADSRADAWYLLWLIFAIQQTALPLIRPYLFWITLEIVLQVFSYLFDLCKYGRIASLHAYSAKLWGLFLFAAVFGILVLHTGFPWIPMAVGAGIISFLDALAIKIFLKTWQHDVPSCIHAYRMSRR